MKPLIEVNQPIFVQCDNPKCDFKITTEDAKQHNFELIEMINQGCPKCGENLLTKQDYLTYQKIMGFVNWMNKYFSWLTFFSRKKADKKTFVVHAHNGINISEKP